MVAPERHRLRCSGRFSERCGKRSHLGAVPNHYIRGPVRFWSLEGPDEPVLQVLAERRFRDLARLAPSRQAGREQLTGNWAWR